MPNHDIIVLGASAGGVEALTTVVKTLPRSLPAAVFIVLHVPEHGSVLPRLLDRAGVIPVEHARDGAPIPTGTVVVAPPGRHLLLQQRTMVLGNGPRENGHRPAIDVLFRSAARVHGPRVIGAILSGSGDDGTAGLQLVKAHGGIALVQDEQDAVFPDMPRNASRHVRIDATATAAELGPLLVRICRDGVPARVPGSPEAAVDEAQESMRIAIDKAGQELGERMNAPSVLSCPDCGGVLWEIKEGRVARYRCHVGHSYTASSLEDEKAQALETALWTAVRMFRERAMLSRRGATRALEQGMKFVVANLHDRAEDAERCATLIEGLLAQEHVGGGGSTEDPASG